MKKHLVLLGLVCALGLLFSTPSFACSTIECEISEHNKDTLTIIPPPNPVAATTVPVMLTGESTSVIETLRVYAIPGASTCPEPGLELIPAYPHYEDYSVPQGPFAVTASLEIMQPGVYLLCGYLGSVRTSVEMTVGISAGEAKQAGEAKTKELAEQAPATFLSVKTVSHRLGSAAHPGATKFEIGTSRYAYVTITVNDGWTRQYRASGKTQDVTFNWSCRHPGTRRYVVTAVGGAGPTFSRSGHFKTITNSWCASTKKGEEEANRDVREEERHQAEQERRRAEEKHRQEVERFDSNCKKLGGKPIELPTSEGLKIYCRGPNGGVIPVPH